MKTVEIIKAKDGAVHGKHTELSENLLRPLKRFLARLSEAFVELGRCGETAVKFLAERQQLEQELAASVKRVGGQLAALEQQSIEARTALGQVTELLLKLCQDIRGDLIERNVKEPLYLELRRCIQGFYTLAIECPEKSDILRNAAEETAATLELHGVEVLCPKQGDAFDRRRQCARGERGTDEASLHGKISCTYAVGLARGERVIQPAEVEVFRFSGQSKSNLSPKRENHEHNQ